MTDGHWEEIEVFWMDEWPFEDDPEEYDRINSILPHNLTFMPFYTDEPSVRLMDWVQDGETDE